MESNPEIKQVSTIGAHGTQIGIQNINMGMTPQAASDMAISLFMENFPKLKEEACRVACERVDELSREIVNKLGNEGVKDFSAFKEPDVQYTLLEAEKVYARFGTDHMLDILSGLLCRRVQNDKDFKLKVTIDKAIEIAPVITAEQMDYLSFLFYRDNAKKAEKNNYKHLVKEYMRSGGKNGGIDFNDIQYLLMHGCLILNLHAVTDRYISKSVYTKRKIKEAFINALSYFSIVNFGKDVIQNDDDYSLSYVGILLAIMNIERKTEQKYDLHEWIK